MSVFATEVGAVLQRWPTGIVAVWYPLLSDGRHAPLLAGLEALGAPLHVAVTRDEFYLFRNELTALKWPTSLLPGSMHNEGNYIISLANLCRWLGQQAEALGVDIYPGFAAQEVIIEDDVVRGIITGDHGLDRNGQAPAGVYTAGVELRARTTLFAEGSRGHLGKRLQQHFQIE